MKKIAIVSTLFVSGLILAGCGASQPTQQNNNENPGEKPATSQPSSSASPSQDSTVSQGDVVFFWGEGCPHCTNVEKFLESNKELDEKLKIKKIEVFKDINGQKLFLEKVKECKLETPGVPVLYKDGKCTQGDQPIIEELKKN